MSALPLTIGLELEFEKANVANTLRPTYEGGPFTGMPSGWIIKTDASCGPEPDNRSKKGFEAVSPVFEEDRILFEHVNFLTTFLGQRAAVLNERCGLHIHLGFPNIVRDSSAMRRLLLFLIRYEGVFYALCPPHRRENDYCAPVSDHILEYLNNSEDDTTAASAWRYRSSEGPRSDNRFHWLNAKSFYTHGTLEFRCPEATLNPIDILGWIYLLVHVCDNIVRKPLHKNSPKIVAARSRSRHVAFLIHEMLQKCNSYGKAATSQRRAIDARLWVHHRFHALHGYAYRTALNRMTREKRAHQG